MSETVRLATWNEVESLGKIPDSEWVCQTPDSKALEVIHELGGNAPDTEVLRTADDRNHHLEMIRFPEGYEAVRIINSEKDQPPTDSSTAYRYGGTFTSNCRRLYGPCAIPVPNGSPIPLESGREITSVRNFEWGTQSIIKPTVDKNDSDDIHRLNTGVVITPESKGLIVAAEGTIRAIPDAHMTIDMQEENGSLATEIAAYISGPFDKAGHVKLELDENGGLNRFRLYRLGFLKAIGFDTSGIEITPQTGWVTLDESQQARIVDATAEALGMERWSGLDLRLTASGLYAAMGQGNFDPSTLLIPRT